MTAFDQPGTAPAPRMTWSSRALFVAGVTAVAGILAQLALLHALPGQNPYVAVVVALIVAATVGLADFCLSLALAHPARPRGAVRAAAMLAWPLFAYVGVLLPMLEQIWPTDRAPIVLLGAVLLALVAGWTAGWLRYLDEQSAKARSATTAVPVRTMIAAACITATMIVALPSMRAVHTVMAEHETLQGPKIIGLSLRQRMLSERIGRLALIDGTQAAEELREAIAKAEAEGHELAGLIDGLSANKREPVAVPPSTVVTNLRQGYIGFARQVTAAPDQPTRAAAATRLQSAIGAYRVAMNDTIANMQHEFDHRAADRDASTVIRLALGPVVIFGLVLVFIWPLIALLINQQHALVERLAVWKRDREAQRKIEEKFKSFTEIAADWCWETDAELRFVAVTEGFTTRMHWHPSWLYAQTLPGLQRLNTKFARSKTADGEITTHRHFRDHCVIMLSASGTPRFVRLHAQAQHDERGAFTGYFGTATDITEGMQQAQANEQADRLQSLGTMAAGLAHEFNNVLGIISGHSELAKAALERGAANAEDLTPILEASRRGARLTKSLLSFGRKRADAAASRVDIADALSELKLFLKPLIGPAYTLEIEAAEDLAVVLNKDVFVQAVVNLVLNARDAMANGGTITLGARRLDDGARMELTVTDEGAGIPPHLIDKIFDPFFTTKDVGKGSGLGLPLVFRFAKDHGGEVRVTSQVGHGSTFTLVLPLATGTAPLNAPVENGATGSANFVGLKAIVVDDEPALGTAFAAMLNELGFAVRTFTDPNEALAAIDDDPDAVDVLVSDVLMPEVDGPALARLARALRADLKVLFVTGQPEHMGDDKTKGASDIPILGKPFERAELAAALQRLFARAAAA